MTSAVLADWRTAPVDAKVKATLGFLEKLTLTPEAVGPADAEAVRAAGVSDAALADAIHVCAAFNMIDRIADALQFHVPDAAAFARSARTLLKRGYV